MKPLMFAALATLAAGSASAIETNWTPAYLGCTFTQSAFSSHSELPWMAGKDRVLNVSSTKLELAFAAIDFEGQHAQLVGNQGSAQIGAYRGGFGSVVFLEWTPAGSVNMTTVLPPTKDGTIRAITSRHVVDMGSGYMACKRPTAAVQPA